MMASNIVSPIIISPKNELQKIQTEIGTSDVHGRNEVKFNFQNCLLNENGVNQPKSCKNSSRR
jgi:hypothetical protein